MMQLPEYRNMYELETSHWWYTTLHQLLENAAAKERREGGFKILDAGCGTGRVMEILGKYGEVEGLDYSAMAVALARSRGMENIRTEDLAQWNCTPNTYNLITSMDVLYAVDDDIAILKKFYHALKPGGTLLLNLPAFEMLRREHDVVVNTKRRYHRKQLMKELTKIGFTVTKATYRQMHLFIFIFLRKKLGRIFPKKSPAESDLKRSPRWINKIFERIGTIENSMILHGINLPVGSSLFVIAKK